MTGLAPLCYKDENYHVTKEYISREFRVSGWGEISSFELNAKREVNPKLLCDDRRSE